MAESSSDRRERAEVGCFRSWRQRSWALGKTQAEVSAVVAEVDALDIDGLAVDFLHELHRADALEAVWTPRGGPPPVGS